MIIVSLFAEFCDAFKFRDLIQSITVRMISFISLRVNQGQTDFNFTIDVTAVPSNAELNQTVWFILYIWTR